MRPRIMSKEWFIYSLLDARGILFYVGRTRNLKRRLTEHKWVFGRSITMEVLECGVGTQREWSPAERRWIAEMRSRGFILKNRSNGGSGPGMASDETREKQRKATTGRVVKWAAKISETQKGVPKDWSPEGRKRVQSTQFKKDQQKEPAVEAKRKVAQLKSVKTFWDNMTPEYREDFLRRRTEKVIEALAAKKIVDVESLTIQEVASVFNVDRNTIYRWIKEGRLQVVEVGGFKRIPNDCVRHMKETEDRSPWKKLTEPQVIDIRSRYDSGGISCMKIAEEYGVTSGNVSAIIRRQSWKHI